ncbi:HET-domain-containing protein [Trematosphaeria pertusa]|uniref:HET-domain-containing protein n=1 Tax=Trematosphaeria pertusa TaxID=390896 RepID=A0A6A6IGL8_9PLEO|nr:HET-domain-containing protein [Trematosphaeria pertusa]KAF2249178.1 HET-domain-containing protein [Trematosphaeria pertusa]
MTSMHVSKDKDRHDATEDAEELIRNKRRKITPSQGLCEQCRSLKLDRSFERAFKFYKLAREGTIPRSQELQRQANGPLYYEDCFLVHRFKDRLATPSGCLLCHFFRTMRVQPGLQEDYKLLAFCSTESRLFCLPRLKASSAWEGINHSVFMAVVPDIASIPPNGHGELCLESDIPAVGSIYRLRSGESGDTNATLEARELQERADFTVIREWLSFCNEHHDHVCKRSTSHGNIARGFRVINCDEDPPIVEEQEWGITYAALSYVWGKGPEAEKRWPATVLDAVAVMKEMGMKYLWVDRLCIDQQNEEEKQYLIARMTTIYSEADFTIVAAAGSGAGYGIPGVRATLRKPQAKFRLDSGSVLLSTHRDPRLDILESEWSTRGWTYQEGILSNRRLVFTDHQAYWECRCMAIHDGIRLPLHLVHEPSKARMADFMLAGIFKGVSYSGGAMDDDGEVLISDDSYSLDYGFPIHDDGSIRAKFRGLEEHIRAFSARNLGYDEDSLNAFQGILGLYDPININALLGIPIWFGKVAGRQSGPQVTFALSVCSWYHRSDPSLRMFVAEDCQRRTHLPSWTWAGWKGTVSWRSPPQEEHSVMMCNLIEVDTLDFLWVADIYLREACVSSPVRLADVRSAQELQDDDLDLRVLEVRNPLTLKYFTCKPTKKEWSWRRHAGRRGRERYDVGRTEWDFDWHRLAGRLVCISVSMPMTRDQWTQKHRSREFISILMFAGRDPSIKHGRARFLTLRKVISPGRPLRWERVGTVQLTISDPELSKYQTNGEILDNLPVQRERETFAIW